MIRGKFLKSRFLSINTYDRNGNSVDGIADKAFTTVSGQNPYAVPGAPSSDDTFQVTVVPQPKMKDGENPPQLPPGEIYCPPPSDFFASQGYVIFRSYVDAEPGGDYVQRVAGHHSDHCREGHDRCPMRTTGPFSSVTHNHHLRKTGAAVCR